VVSGAADEGGGRISVNIAMATLVLAGVSLPADHTPAPPAGSPLIGAPDVLALIRHDPVRAPTLLDTAALPPAIMAPLAIYAAQQTPPVQAPQDQTPQDQAAPEDLSEDILVRARSSRGDPLMGINTAAFNATQAVDRAVVSPASKTYQKIPKPLRMGLRNFLFNLREPIIFVNYLLQLKPGKAAETAGRFLINSTVGIGGVLDVAVAKPFRLPRRRNSFANTLGYYGVKPGPFLFLPLLGPTTVRDLFGIGFDQFIVPTPIQPFRDQRIGIPASLASSLDSRTRIDDRLEAAKKSGDFYGAMRTFYLDRRQAEIDHLKGRIKAVTITLDSPVERVTPPPVVPTLPVPQPGAPATEVPSPATPSPAPEPTATPSTGMPTTSPADTPPSP
jgi:phospholipid-binding lipoprotein MlaA